MASATRPTVVGVQAVVEGLDVLVEGRRLVAEHGEQPVVPGQPAGGQVEVEGADPGGVDGQPPAQPVALELPDQRGELQFGDGGLGELAQRGRRRRRTRSRGSGPKTQSAPMTWPRRPVSGMPR